MMNKKMLTIITLLACVYTLVLVVPIAYWQKNNSNGKVESAVTEIFTYNSNETENLGKPFTKANYANNVWDMQVFNGKIYLGHGNSSNIGPNPNSGPVPIISFDPNTNKFTTEFTVNEEQIDVYRILNGKLVTPGHDSQESWDLGNFYRYETDKWVKYRNLTNGIHVYDMTVNGNYMYAALGTEGTEPSLLSSTDDGKTWKLAYEPNATNSAILGRRYSLFSLGSKVYAINNINSYPSYTNNTIAEIENGVAKPLKITSTSFFPDKTDITSYKIARPTSVNGGVIYIAGKIVNDHQNDPGTAYFKSEIGSARKINLPNSSALATDILNRGGYTYILAYARNSATDYTNIVYSSTDLNTWTEKFSFKSTTFARSFEELNGDFYFGLGTDTTEMSADTGTILRVKAHLNAAMVAPTAIPTVKPIVIPTTKPTTIPTIKPTATSTPKPTVVPTNNSSADGSFKNNVTSSIEFVGKPFTKSNYANNVWDMQSFDGKIYLGHGDWNANVGPIPIISYNPTGNKFTTEFTVNEESIDVYRVTGGQLYVPGIDSQESWSLGNYYRYESGKWVKYRNIPNGVHVFDILANGNYLYTVIGADGTQPAILASNDNGKTWKPTYTYSTTKISPTYFISGRQYSLFKLGGKVYSTYAIYTYPDYPNYIAEIENGVAKPLLIKSTSFLPGIITSTSFFPGRNVDGFYILRNFTNVNNGVLYLAGVSAYYPSGDVYFKQDINTTARKIILPNTSVKATDIVNRGSATYILGFLKNSPTDYTTVVYQSTDLTNWTEKFYFKSTTKARSFEELNGDFYFGMGTGSTEVPYSSESGKILRVKAGVPMVVPTAVPTVKPTAVPTVKPTTIPTIKPTAIPTAKPTTVIVPTAVPTSTTTSVPVTSGFKAEFWNYGYNWPWLISISRFKNPVFTTQVATINFNWGNASPNSRVRADKFMARFTGTQNFEGGQYQFTTTSDDGVRLYVDDKLVIDNWTKHPAQVNNTNVYLLSGNHKIRLEYFEYQGLAVIKLAIKKL